MIDAAAERDDLIAILAKVGAIFRRDFKLAISYEAGFALQLVALVPQVAVTFLIAQLVPASSRFGVDGRAASFFSYTIVNLAFMALQTAALSSFSRTIREGQLQGTLEVVLSTPTTLPVVVLAGGLWPFAFTGVTAFAMVGLGAMFGLDLRHVDLPALATFLVLTVLAISPLGVLSAAATIVFRQTAPFEFMLNSLSYVLAGVYIPVSLLPAALASVGWFLPLTHALAGIRGAIGGAPLAHNAADALWLLASIVVLMPLSLWAFRGAIEHAKKNGSLSGY